MLGPIKLKHVWNWTACGKHPVARDYFRLNSKAVPLLEAFSGWIEKGYQMIDPNKNKSLNQYSWRFWAKGPDKKNLAFGIVKDSCDALGRSHPFLIMGTGPLEAWNDHWDLLPLALAETWGQMEYLSAKRLLDFTQMEDEVRIIRPPYPKWSEYTYQKGNPRAFEPFSSDKGGPGDSTDINKSVANLTKETEFFVSLESTAYNDPLLLAGQWHSFLKTKLTGVPNAVFMGGIPEETYLAVFVRPLVPSDFVRLWSICTRVN